MELRRQSYIVQTAAYLRNKDYQRAYEFAKEFSEKFPEEMVAHYFLSAASFWLKKYEEAILEGSKAFNQCSSDDDMLACATITASAYYETNQYEKGYHLLLLMEQRKKSENLERLLFLFSLARKDAKEAALHLNELYKMNHQSAEEIALRYVS